MSVEHHRHTGGAAGPVLDVSRSLEYPADYQLRELFVDINAVSSSEDGKENNPYLTIMAAVNAVIAAADNSDLVAYIIRIAAGMYTETLTLEDSALYNLAFISRGGPARDGYSAGIGAVILDPESGAALESEASNTQLHYLYFKGIHFKGDIAFDGLVNDSLFLEKGAIFENCGIDDGGAVTVKCAEKFSWRNSFMDRGTVLWVENVWSFEICGEGHSDWPMAMGGQSTVIADTGEACPYHMRDAHGGGDQAIFRIDHAFCQRNKWTMTTGGTGVLMIQCINGLFSCGSGITMPDNGNLYGYTGIYVGNVTMNAGGALFLYNTVISGTLTKNGCAENFYNEELGDGAIDTAQLAALAVEEAKIGAGAVTAGKIGAAAVTNAKLDPTLLQFAEVEISSDEVKALYTTAKELVEAPGAGYTLEFISLLLMLDWDGGTIYTKGSANEMQVRYTDKNGTGASHYASVSTFIVAAADIFLHIHAPSEPENYQCNVYPEANEPLVLALDGGNPTAGTSPLKAFVTYRVVATG